MKNDMKEVIKEFTMIQKEFDIPTIMKEFNDKLDD